MPEWIQIASVVLALMGCALLALHAAMLSQFLLIVAYGTLAVWYALLGDVPAAVLFAGLAFFALLNCAIWLSPRHRMIRRQVAGMLAHAAQYQWRDSVAQKLRLVAKGGKQ